jgi:myo-inositol-1(or 4)-monophosphatase
MLPMLNTAVKAARRAGVIINRASDDVDRLTVHSKGENDFVTEVDQKAEQAIIQTLLDAYPDHAILAEESGASGTLGEAEYEWIIDPLDGTTNFLHGFPQYCISIALVYRGQLSVAVIYDPVRNDLYTALRGRGAFLNERRIRVSKRDKLQGALIGTGFPYRDFTHLDAYTAMFKDLVQKTAGLRRPGSAALDLAWLACRPHRRFLRDWPECLGYCRRLPAGAGSRRAGQRFLRRGKLPAVRQRGRRHAEGVRATVADHHAASDACLARRSRTGLKQ